MSTELLKTCTGFT